MANILQCNVFLNICTLTMDRALEDNRTFTESHLQKVSGLDAPSLPAPKPILFPCRSCISWALPSRRS